MVDDWDIALVESQMQGGGIGQEKHLAIVFADIRGFTTRSESMLAYDVIYLLNSCFQCVGRIIHEFGGEINTYIGDGFMALFGWAGNPSFSNVCGRAVAAGLHILQAVNQLNQHLDMLMDNPLRVGIGIHSSQPIKSLVPSC